MKSLVYGRKWSACSPCYVITQQCHLKWVWAPVEKIGHLLAKREICIEMKLVNQDYLIGFMVHLESVVCIGYTMSTGRYHQQGLIASSPITSWQIDGEEMERVTDFIFLGSKITADGNCSHEIKRHLLLGRKAMTNLDSIRKAETLLCQQSMHSQSYGFSSIRGWMCNWTIKKAEC